MELVTETAACEVALDGLPIGVLPGARAMRTAAKAAGLVTSIAPESSCGRCVPGCFLFPASCFSYARCMPYAACSFPHAACCLFLITCVLVCGRACWCVFCVCVCVCVCVTSRISLISRICLICLIFSSLTHLFQFSHLSFGCGTLLSCRCCSVTNPLRFRHTPLYPITPPGIRHH